MSNIFKRERIMESCVQHFNKSLRLKRIRVGELFDRFNYDIDLNNGFNVGILIAPNGCGKTTIFNLINFIFNHTSSLDTLLEYRNIVNVPFGFCECTLSNGNVVTLERKTFPYEELKKGEKLKSRMAKLKYSRMDAILGNRTEENIQLTLHIKSKKGNKKIKITEDFYESISDLTSNDPLSLDDLNLALSDWDVGMDTIRKLPQQLRRRMDYPATIIAENLEKYECNLCINYVRANRLHAQTYSEISPLFTIKDHARLLYSQITREYNKRQREMNENLPKMYLNMDSTLATKDSPSFKQRLISFIKDWESYLSDIIKYLEIGFVCFDLQEQESILKVDGLKDAFKEKEAFLTIYLKALKETLKPFEEYYPRLKLFVDIFNHRNSFTHKKIIYGGEEGITVMVDGTSQEKVDTKNEPDKKTLPLECLSSGEKNDLIMFYNLIFGSWHDGLVENGLVLVDEPEISLHIDWQEEYLDRLLEICEKNHMQVMIATHSPNIVNGHFELYAAQGLEYGR